MPKYFIAEIDGAVPRFQEGGVPPDGAVEVEEATYRSRLAELQLPEPPPALIITYKADIYRRCTEAEADAMEMALAATSVRQRRLFEFAQHLDHSAEEFAPLRGAFVEMFGEARASELLAAS